MLFLDILVAIIMVIFVYLLITQVIIPSIFGLKLFPIFKKNDLVLEVEATRDIVATMKEQNSNLSELQVLLKSRAELEKKISALKNPVETLKE